MLPKYKTEQRVKRYIYTHTIHTKMKTTLFSRNREEKNYELFFEPEELHRVQYLLETKQFLGLSELQKSEDGYEIETLTG